jgi:hypothetical protein
MEGESNEKMSEKQPKKDKKKDKKQHGTSSLEVKSFNELTDHSFLHPLNSLNTV